MRARTAFRRSLKEGTGVRAETALLAGATLGVESRSNICEGLVQRATWMPEIKRPMPLSEPSELDLEKRSSVRYASFRRSNRMLIR